MRYFDCCCEIGPRTEKDPLTPWTAADVLRWMDHCGISAALVTHTLAMQGNVYESRRRLREDTAAAPGRFFPAWTVVPPDARDTDGDGKKLLAEMAAEGVRAVKLFPRTHNYPMTPSVLAPMLKPLEAARILTLIDANELPAGPDGAYAAMDALLTLAPDLPVVLQRITWGIQRVITALMNRHRNLRVEFSFYQINRGIEQYAKWYGPERLLFGTGLPAMSAGAARCFIDYADIPARDKALIAGGNLATLLGGVELAEAAIPGDSLIAAAAAGRPLDGEVLDAHCHVLPEGRDSSGSYVMYHGDADGLAELNSRMGIRASTLISWTGPLACDTVDGNEVVSRALRRHGGRFYGLIHIDPIHLSREELLAEIHRRLGEPGWVGMKPYPTSGLAYDHALFEPCWQIANQHGLMILTHLGGRAGSTATIAKLAGAYPEAQWAIAHSGGSFPTAREVVAVMKQRANIWAELTLTPVTNGVIEWMVEQVGDDRILFGTDAPMRDPRQQLGWVVWADLPEASRRKILGGNFRRLLGMRKSTP